MPLPSDDQLTLLHNPRCSKSRAALALLEERGAKFETRLYLDDPLSRDELVELAGRLGRAVPEWTRKGEAAFGEAGLAAEAGDSEILDAMVAAPILMERPILVSATRAIVGRPPDDIVELL